jgi:2-phospho-L-lactate/phosphoenolpyruvate guanylyltransferase
VKGIVIPVKSFANAKSRLAGCLQPKERAELAKAFCLDLFATIAKVRAVDAVFVISNEISILGWAKQNGWVALRESQQLSEAASVDFASQHCESLGVNALLRIPTDIPLLRSEDVEEIFSALDEAPSCVMAPSRDRTGTNALLRSPPRAFASFFGRDSLARHCEAARAAGVAVKIIRNPRIELDVDEPGDLELLRGCLAADSHTGRWFSERDRVPRAVSDPLHFPTAQPH